VQLLPGDAGWRLPLDAELDAAPERLVGRYAGDDVWVAPVDGDDLPGSWFDPVDLPEPLDPLAEAAVGDLIRGRYDVERGGVGSTEPRESEVPAPPAPEPEPGT
jgi:hypothetical protein